MTAVRRMLLVLVAAAAPAVLGAQQATGIVSGQVTELQSRDPVVGARVEAITMPARRVVAATTTKDDGRYAMPRVPVGSYSVVVTRIGYSLKRVDAVLVETGRTATVDVQLAPLPTELEQTTISASRAPEKVLDAPASISIVSERQIREKPAITTADYLRGTPGVDATQGGLAQTNIVARGFNNAFSGSLLMLQDNRFASVPSLRVNIPFLVPTTNEDIDRIEVVLGPGAALYGPNASSGVMHVITKSPFDSKGTTLTLDGGERSVMRLGMRHANTLGDRIGFKVSGEYMRGRDWEYRDPAEPARFPATPSTPADRDSTPNNRDFDLERYGGEARADIRLPDGSEIITSYGLAHIVNSLELTGANGTAQIRNWTMQTLQTRYRKGKFFAQAFGNLSDAGNEDGSDLDGTFLLRTGQPIVDRSRLGAVQFQQGVDWGARQTFLFGGEGVWTNPRTEGTINGRNEEDDDITEVGGYVHSVTRLAPKWEVVSALRVDVNSRLDGRFYSPRAALVFKPTALQNIRASYNRAYSTPTNFNMFLDLLQGSLRPTTGLPYDIRALGVPEDGFSFRRDCANGIGGLCMRSPFPYANGQVAAGAFSDAVGFQNALAVAVNGGAATSIANAIRANVPSITAAQAAAMASAAIGRMATLNPSATQAGTALRLLVPGSATPFQPYSADQVVDIEPLKASFVNNFELGYKGIIGDRLRVAVDGWYQRRENFVTAALNFTPNVFVGATQTAGLINPEMQTAFRDYLVTQGYSNAQATGIATALANGIAPVIAGTLATIPAGTVVPDSRVTTNGDIGFTYRNIDQTISLYGSDVAVDFLFTNRFSMAATYSWVSDVAFPEIQNGADVLRLNAPNHKSSLTARWADDAKGYSVEMRGRYMNAFKVNSAVFIGHVPVNAFMDASFSWRLPIAERKLTWGINATNILDNRQPSFVGVPDIGRLVLTRLQYSF